MHPKYAKESFPNKLEYLWVAFFQNFNVVLEKVTVCSNVYLR